MKHRILLAIVALLSLASCGSVTIPATARLENGEVLIGTSTASIKGGTFEVATPTRTLVCKGNYDAFDTSMVLSAPVTCSDGRYGTLTVTRTPDRMAGEGVFRLADGTGGRVAFGRLAATIVSQPTTDLQTANLASSGQPSQYNANLSSNLGTTGCQSGNYYGSTSCITGQPRTTYVSGYYRKNGTYVRPYYRSKK